MSLKVKLKPVREVFSKPATGYKVLACERIDGDDVILNRYGNFTLSGSNLSVFNLNEEYELEIREDERGKYAGAYILVGYAGIEANADGITIKPEQEILVLRHICDGNQPEYVHEAYPNFVQMVLDGKESEIDYKKIYNVGPVRFEAYVNGVKGYFRQIRYIPIASEWEITDDKDIEKLIKVFARPEDLEERLSKDPYYVYSNLLNYPFARTDRYVLAKRPEMIDSEERCLYACLEVLRRNELDGDTRIYSELLEDMVSDLVPEAAGHIKDVIENKDNRRIYYDGEQEYVSNMVTYQAEVTIAENIKARVKKEPLGLSWGKFTTIDGMECTDEQKKILDLANQYQICMLRGYAGSGKSTVMKALVLALEDAQISYAQLAPTGKAAKRLRETTGRYASTIHMFLTSYEHSEEGVEIDAPFIPSVIIVDEMSMVGVELLARLFKVVNNNTRFVFVCDEAQLASISCGNIVQDIIDSDIVPTASLTKIFRYGTSGLATVATDTRNGCIGTRLDDQFSDYQFMAIKDNPIRQILNVYESLLDKYSKDDIMILSPFNKGPAGTVAINNAIQSRFNKHPGTDAVRELSTGDSIMFKVGDKVINTHNEYTMPAFSYDEDGSLVDKGDTIMVMNGDVGYVRYVKLTKEGVVMAVEFDTGMANIDSSMMSNLLLGYAISIHKSQGSESKAVILITDKSHKRMISANLMYVGDSRAKEQLIEIGDIETIKEGLERHEQKERETWLYELLKEE